MTQTFKISFNEGKDFIAGLIFEDKEKLEGGKQFEQEKQSRDEKNNKNKGQIMKFKYLSNKSSVFNVDEEYESDLKKKCLIVNLFVFGQTVKD